MIAPQGHDVHKGHASESHGFAPVAPVQVTVRDHASAAGWRSHAPQDAAPPTHKHHGCDTSEHVPLSGIRNLVFQRRLWRGAFGRLDRSLRSARCVELNVAALPRTVHRWYNKGNRCHSQPPGHTHARQRSQRRRCRTRQGDAEDFAGRWDAQVKGFTSTNLCAKTSRSHVVHVVVADLDHALQALFRRGRSGETPGSPRFEASC